VLGFGTQRPALDHTLRAHSSNWERSSGHATHNLDLDLTSPPIGPTPHHRFWSSLTPPRAHISVSSISLNHRSWQYAYNAVLCTITMIYLSSILIYAAYVIYSARKIKKINRNVTSTTLIFVTLAALFHWLWHAGVYTSNVIQQSSRPMIVFQKPVTIPGFSIFETWAFLSFPLMYDPCK
jgi:hypothetical protein